ncbi:penicillin acylase family protein [bacterium]|nr:penicillin acylase family protein [bacterium]RQV98950.1 MAG: penicillin acylase family protein [bacterium]
MHKGLKIGLVIFSVVVLGLVILCVWGVRMITSSLPQDTGEPVVEELQSDVHVYRDDYHVPHVMAKNEYDLFFAQGYITAQDRFWQMDLWRRMASGRLSEILGSSSIRADSMMIVLGIRRTSRRIVPELSPESRRVFQAYADGVNRYIQDYGRRLPIEFRLLNYKPSPWMIEDCVTLLRWFGWQFSTGWIIESIMGAMIDQVGLEKTIEIFPSQNRVVSQIASWGNISLFDLFRHIRPFCEEASIRSTGYGGHGWAISGNRSITGKPLLANTIHSTYSNPSIWYEIQLTEGDFNVSGISYPGLPLVIAGHNDHIGWGITPWMVDCQDLFIESMDSSDPSQFLDVDQSKPIETVDEEILLRNGSSIPVRVSITDHGPIVAEMTRMDGMPLSVSLQWTGYDISDEGLSLYKLNRAGNWESFREALREFHVPVLNVIYADAEGDIGQQTAGKIPIRPMGVDFLPRSSDDPSYHWQGFIPYDQLVSVHNPDEGWIIVTDRPFMEVSPYSISDIDPIYYPSQRIRQLLSEKEIHSLTDFKRIQTDVLSLFARDVMDLIIVRLKEYGFNEDLEREWVNKLDEWNGEMKTGSGEAALFETLVLHLMKNLFHDELGDTLYDAYIESDPYSLEKLSRLLKQRSSLWFDHIGTPDIIEDKWDIVVRSYRESVAFLKDQFGENVSAWTWGALHTLSFQHPLGGHPLLGNALDLGPFPVGGSGMTVDMKAYDLKNPFSVIRGGSARIIMEADNWDHSVSIIPTGQSGQPLDAHYKDQLPLYLGNMYHIQISDTLKIKQSGWNCLILKSGE